MCYITGGQGSRLDGKGKYLQILNKQIIIGTYSLKNESSNKLCSSKFSGQITIIKTKINFPVVIDKFKENVGPLAASYAAISYVNGMARKKWQ